MIALACDHGGFDMKQIVIEYLEENGIEYKDFGCYDKTSCDYPVFARPAAEAVASGECEKGIVVCTTGIGISIVANKVKGIRAAVCNDPYAAKMTRLHMQVQMKSASLMEVTIEDMGFGELAKTDGLIFTQEIDLGFGG